MRRPVSLLALLMAAAMGTAAVSAQGYAPIVTMTVTLPDGESKELSVPESGLAQATLKDGSEYGFRPTMHDDQGKVTTITIFKMSPSPAEAGTVEAKLGAAAVASKTSPAFKVAVKRVGKTT